MKDSKGQDSSNLNDPAHRRRLPPLLRRAWYSLNQAFRRKIANSGITPDQFTILRNLVEAPENGMTQSELSTLMSSDPNTIASLLNRMENAGLIERRTHERDRRAHRVVILTKGREQYSVLREVAADLQATVLSVLPETRREQFLRDLESVADSCAHEQTIAGKKPAKRS